ncbi:MAG TPA: anthranilate synthase component I, partial [Nitrospira sp.]|nr:anthranilate synthase component I [Nitrospira sp.]
MAKQTYSLTLDEFRGLATEGNLIPLYREILADFETPVSAFAKIDQGPTAYLLESVAGGENWARYSFLGSGSSAVLHEEKGDLILTRGKKRLKIQSRGNPLERVRELMEEYRPVTVPGLPRFVGGAVGYLSYDVVRTFEELPSLRRDSLGMPELAFLLTDTLLIFDNVSQKIKVVANAYLESTTERAIREAYRHATARI